ncbi:aa3-type cytochrome oxidase subunit CtaJ [Mycobacterium sp. MMS18-G62]
MSTALTHSLLGGVPLAITLVLVALIWGVGKHRKGPHPATYELSEPWTHEPILWASDEPADHGHGGHGSHPVTIGGGASGKW